jgi:hypothetical protein
MFSWGWYDTASLASLRGTPEFDQLLHASKRCQDRFLQERNEKAP